MKVRVVMGKIDINGARLKAKQQNSEEEAFFFSFDKFYNKGVASEESR